MQSLNYDNICSVAFYDPGQYVVGQFIPQGRQPPNSTNRTLDESPTVTRSPPCAWVSMSTGRHKIEITADEFHVHRLKDLDDRVSKIAQQFTAKGYVIVGHYTALNPHCVVKSSKAHKKLKQTGDIVYAYECIKTPINSHPLFTRWLKRPQTIILSGATDWYSETIRQDQATITVYEPLPKVL
jgi:hypothetical protein